jgi:ribose transport system substrate-binding protein
LRKLLIVLLSIGCLTALYFTVFYFYKVLGADVFHSSAAGVDESRYRLVLISQELNSPFWSDVESGARSAAEARNADIEFWGSYRSNEENFIKSMEIAIASHVDGIIVQGIPSEEFNRITKYKATMNGIPIITIAHDADMNQTLRKTYVGTNQKLAGTMIGEQTAADLQGKGKVIILAGNREEEYQRLRLRGVLETLSRYPAIRSEIVSLGQMTNKQLLNDRPDIDAYIGIETGSTAALVKEIAGRSKVGGIHFYSFDEDADTTEFMRKGFIDATIRQSPRTMGSLSVELMVQWLNNEVLPLNLDGYYTGIRMLKAEDLDE